MLAPVFTVPPAFVVVVLVMAISAYLHSLAKDRESEIDSIEANKIDKFPENSEQRTKRLKYLESSRDMLNFVAPVLIVFSIAILLRITGTTIGRLPDSGQTGVADIVSRWFDLGAMIFLDILFVGLFFMHRRGCRHREQMREIVARSRASSRQVSSSAGVAGVVNNHQNACSCADLWAGPVMIECRILRPPNNQSKLEERP